jgi:hypothetical protein
LNISWNGSQWYCSIVLTPFSWLIDEKMNWFCDNQIPFKWEHWMPLHANWIGFKFSNLCKLNSNILN